jgi:hypothetical protein
MKLDCDYPETSPFDPELEKYIEKGIWKIVKALNAKGYLTINSCEGHFLHGDIPYVTFCITDPALYSSIYSKLKLPGINIQLLPSWIQIENEKERLKELLHTDKKVWFVYVTFNGLFFPILKHWFFARIKRLENERFY